MQHLTLHLRKITIIFAIIRKVSTSSAYSFTSRRFNYRSMTVQTSMYCTRTNELPRDISTHYVFLVHGWLGNSSEMGYLQKAIEREASAFKDGTKKIITYSPTCNDSNTTDGIANGGERLAHEVTEYIKAKEFSNTSHACDDSRVRNVSISFIGNSLGGLYARYCLTLLPKELVIEEANDEMKTQSITIVLHRHIFATTATPHLGVSSHTYFPIPRLAEQLIGRSLLSTGKDLFRCDDVDIIYKMGTDYDTFLKPLSEFQRRIAIINAYRTDFQVPTCTAGFFNKNSTYPHYIVPSKSKDEAYPSFLVASVLTKPNHDTLVSSVDSVCKRFVMSVKLDALGWEKYLVDVRDFIPLPGLSLPSFLAKKSRQKWQDFLAGNNNGIVLSKEILHLMGESDQLHVPVGHQVMVANSKSDTYSKFTAKGQVVMDYFAKDIVEYLLHQENDKP